MQIELCCHLVNERCGTVTKTVLNHRRTPLWVHYNSPESDESFFIQRLASDISQSRRLFNIDPDHDAVIWNQIWSEFSRSTRAQGGRNEFLFRLLSPFLYIESVGLKIEILEVAIPSPPILDNPSPEFAALFGFWREHKVSRKPIMVRRTVSVQSDRSTLVISLQRLKRST